MTENKTHRLTVVCDLKSDCHGRVSDRGNSRRLLSGETGTFHFCASIGKPSDVIDSIGR